MTVASESKATVGGASAMICNETCAVAWLPDVSRASAESVHVSPTLSAGTGRVKRYGAEASVASGTPPSPRSNRSTTEAIAVSSSARMSMGTPPPGRIWLVCAGEMKLTLGKPVSGTTVNEIGALATVTPPEPVAAAVTVTVLPAEPYGSGSSI